MKKALVSLAAVGVALSLAACSPGGAPSAGGDDGAKVEISLLAPEYSASTADYLRGVAADFTKENPNITVKVETVAWSGMKQKVNTLVSVNTPPDVLIYNKSSIYGADDLVVPIKEILPAETYDDYYPSLLEGMAYEGVSYGMPFVSSVRGMFYNKDLLAKAGVQPPKTWDDLFAAAKAVKAKTGKVGYGMPLAEPEGSVEFTLWAINNGGGWKTGDAWTINSPQNVAALQKMADLYNTGATQPSPWTSERDDIFRDFGEGNIGMIEGASYLPSVLKKQQSKVDYAVIPSPVNGNAPSATLAVADEMMVFKSNEAKQKAAGKFGAYFFRDDVYSKFLVDEGMLPTTKSAAEKMKDEPELGQFLPLLEHAVFLPNKDPMWTKLSPEIVPNLGPAVSGKSTPQQSLDTIQKLAESGK